MGRQTIIQVEMREQSLRALHHKIQTTIIYYVAPICLVIFCMLAFFDPSWQNIAVLIAFFLSVISWVLGHNLFKRGDLPKSVAIFVTTTLVFTTLNAAFLHGGSPTQLLVGALAVIYASFYSKRFLLFTAMGTLLGFVISETAIYVNLYPLKTLSPIERLVSEIPFAALLLYATVIFLRSFRAMNDKLLVIGKETNSRLTNVIRTASNIGQTLEGVVDKIKDASEAFVAKADEQATALQEMSVSIEHIRRSAKDTANSATETQSITAAYQDKSEIGSRQIQKMLAGFREVVEMNEAAKVEFSELAVQADRIEEVLRTNREIAGQIKILATNASIQASKVGKMGRGFRVVANQLKAMIQRTETSLKHSKELLENIRAQANKSRDTIEKSSALVKVQYSQLSDSGELVHEIAHTFIDAANKVKKIAHDAKGQQVRLDEVASGINHLDFTAQELTKSTAFLAESIDQLDQSNQTIKSALIA